MRVAAIVPAAGEGKRMKGKVKKPFLLLKGKPILAHTLDLLERQPFIEKIWVAGPQEEVSSCGLMVEKYHLQKVAEVVVGGKTRQESVWNALKKAGREWDLILVHDAVRPLCPPELVRKVVETAGETKAAILGVAVKDTIKSVKSSMVIQETLDRSKLMSAQTPQVFETGLLFEAFEKALADKFVSTDEASLVERLGKPVRIVEGSYENIKITVPEDLVLADLILGRYQGPLEVA